MNTHTNTDYLERDVKQSEPAKRWVNKWNVDRVYRDVDSGSLFGPGICWSRTSWPSRDTAETRAAKLIEGHKRRSHNIEYLGAFPLDGDGK